MPPPMKRKKKEEEATMSEPKTKYDRQLRIWGEVGQAALEEASILDEKSVGQSKAKSVCAFLQELNDDAVKATFIEENPDTLISTNASFFSQFTLVIDTQLVEDSMVKLDRICREANVMLVFARSYGLAGFVRVSVQEHTVIDSKPDHFLDDLRLNYPWPELKDLVKSKMISMDEDNYKEAIEAAFKVFAPRGINKLTSRSEIQQVCNDTCAEPSSNSSDFWVMVAALKVCRYLMVEDEFSNPSVTEIQKCLADEDYRGAMGFYVLLRAVDRFTANYNKFPGQFDGGMDEDISRLKTTASSLLTDLGLSEMCRFGASELHVVAAFLGGIASQEVIKLVTKQFVPMLGTYIFNGIDHKSQLLTL
ncbi:hypothetical protein Bca101_008454 [Brassica carinata]